MVIIIKTAAQKYINFTSDLVSSEISHKENLSLAEEIKSKKPFLSERFNDHFPTANKAVWGHTQNGYIIYFMLNQKEARASISNTGDLNYFIINTEKVDLPAHFKKKLNNRFNEYEFIHAEKISAFGLEIFYVYLEGDKEYLTLKGNDFQIEKLSKLKK